MSPNYCTVDKTLGFSPSSPKTANCDKQRLPWEHICAWWQRLNFPDYQATLLAVGPLCMLLERCPRVPCVCFRKGEAKERQTCGLMVPRACKCLNYWRIRRHGALLPTSHGSQLVCMPHPTFPQQPASSAEVHPSPGLLTILATSFPKPPRPEIVRSGCSSPLSLGPESPFSFSSPSVQILTEGVFKGLLNKSLSNPSWPDAMQVLANPSLTG